MLTVIHETFVKRNQHKVFSVFSLAEANLKAVVLALIAKIEDCSKPEVILQLGHQFRRINYKAGMFSSKYRVGFCRR